MAGDGHETVVSTRERPLWCNIATYLHEPVGHADGMPVRALVVETAVSQQIELTEKVARVKLYYRGCYRLTINIESNPFGRCIDRVDEYQNITSLDLKQLGDEPIG